MKEEERAKREGEERQAESARRWATRFDVIGDPRVRAAVEDYYGEFYDPEKIIRWWAGLFDPELGAFYYANSARDNEGFLPDMESTYQIAQRLRLFDQNEDLARYLGPGITAKMIEFYRSKQDPEDGYFYHPQWTKEESRKKVMRYTRDQDWTIRMLKWLHSSPLYPTAIDRAVSGGSASTAWEPNAASVAAYVNDLLATRSCESWSNALQTEATLFRAAGMLDTVLDILDARINPEYGLWVTGYDEASDRYYNLKSTPEEETPYGLYTCTYKLTIMYNLGGRLVPYAAKMVENGIKAVLSEDPGVRVTYLFNPWATFGTVRTNLKNHGTPAMLAEYDALISENVLAMLAAVKKTLGCYRCDDGSYGFLQSGSSPTIYGTPVSLGVKEGDVNANNLVISFSQHICNTIGLSDFIPVFNEKHAALMKDLLENAPRIQKRGTRA